jgi:hemerythrin-like domain-containing protein
MAASPEDVTFSDVIHLNMNDVVHAAVRRDFVRLRAALAAVSVDDVDRVRDLRAAWEFIWGELHHHHVIEDRFVWPYVLQHGLLPADLIEQMEAEHQRMAVACGRLSVAFLDFLEKPSQARLLALRSSLEHAVQTADEHLIHEERDVMPALDDHWDAKSWRPVERQIRKVNPQLAGGMFAWLMDTDDEKVLAAIRAKFPQALLWTMSHVFGRAYHRTVAPAWR